MMMDAVMVCCDVFLFECDLIGENRLGLSL
jgi:hypothetical protein